MKDANFCIHEISKTLSGKIRKLLPEMLFLHFTPTSNSSNVKR